MAFPVIGFKSVYRVAAASIVDPGTETGFDVNNIADLKSYTLWKSSVVTSPINIDVDVGAAVQATYICIVNSNLSTLGATITVQSDTTAGFSTPTTLLSAVAVDTDNVWFKGFAVQTAEQFWRVVITDPSPPFASAPFAGVIEVGLSMAFPEYLNPEFDPFFKGVEAVSDESEGGHYLGALLRGQTHKGTLSFAGDAGIARAFYSSDLNAFLDDHAYKRLPFSFILNTGDADFNTARWLKMPQGDNPRRTAVSGTFFRFRLELPVEEAFKEPA